MTMQAYHNDQSLKDAILRGIKDHAAADKIVKGTYWEKGKGCSIGCTLESIRLAKGKKKIDHDDHALCAKETGIPEMLWRLNDGIFEGLPNGKAKEWPGRFVAAISPGADLSRIGWQFLYWLLTDTNVNPGIDDPIVRDAVKQCADALVPLNKGLPSARSAARSAASAAWSAASAARSAARSAASAARSAASAESAARSAAWSVESVESAESAESAAWSVESAESARSAARSAASAAWSAARSAARSAASAESAWSAARSAARSAAWSAAWSVESVESAESAESAAYVLMSDKLIALLEATHDQ